MPEQVEQDGRERRLVQPDRHAARFGDGTRQEVRLQDVRQDPYGLGDVTAPRRPDGTGGAFQYGAQVRDVRHSVRTRQRDLREQLGVREDPARLVRRQRLGELAVDAGVGRVVEAQLDARAEVRLRGDADVVPAQHARDDVDAVPAPALEDVHDGVVQVLEVVAQRAESVDDEHDLGGGEAGRSRPAAWRVRSCSTESMPCSRKRSSRAASMFRTSSTVRAARSRSARPAMPPTCGSPDSAWRPPPTKSRPYTPTSWGVWVRARARTRVRRRVVLPDWGPPMTAAWPPATVRSRYHRPCHCLVGSSRRPRGIRSGLRPRLFLPFGRSTSPCSYASCIPRGPTSSGPATWSSVSASGRGGSQMRRTGPAASLSWPTMTPISVGPVSRRRADGSCLPEPSFAARVLNASYSSASGPVSSSSARRTGPRYAPET